MTEPAARTNRSLMENIRYPGLGTLILVACLSFIPLVWPLLLYVSLRYLTGHRSPGSLTSSIIPSNRNDARPSPVKAATTDASRSASSKRVPFAVAVVAFAAFAVVIAASGWVPEEVNLALYGTPGYGEPGIPAHFDARQTSVVAALASGLGIYFVLTVLMRGTAAPGTISRLALDQALVRTEATNVAPRAEAKVCPRCAEDVKAAALVCRYCGHEFEINAT